MRVRALLAAAVLLATPTAHADDVTPDEVAGFNNGLAGVVIYDGTSGHNENSYRVTAACAFAGVLTPNNTLIVKFGGAVASSTNDDFKVPQLTRIRCVIRSGALEAEAAIQLGSAVAGSTLLDESGPKEWPTNPITVCVEAVAVFGNIDPVIVRIPLICKTPTS